MTATRTLIIGTRGSRLAQIQTDLVLRLLKHGAQSPPPAAPSSTWGLAFEVRTIRTLGDRTQAEGIPLAGLPRGVFVKDLESALLAGSIDLAVHSLKDMTTSIDPRLTIAAVPQREDPRDVLVSRSRQALRELPAGARIGTGSPRRAAQLRAVRADLRFESIRGNVDTRVHKVDNGEYDGAILAAAGLARLGLAGRIAEYFDPQVCLPDPGQGALAVQVRAGDHELIDLLAPLNHAPTRAAVTAERALLRELGGGCKVPIGALAQAQGEDMILHGLVASPDSSEIIRCSAKGPVKEPESLGAACAQLLRQRGAGRLLGDASV